MRTKSKRIYFQRRIYRYLKHFLGGEGAQPFWLLEPLIFKKSPYNPLQKILPASLVCRVAGAGRSGGCWLEPEPEFSPGSGSYFYSTVL